MKRIAIIVFFFGPDPWYLKMFIESCKRNDSIDFLYFSDKIEHAKQDHNVKMIPFQIEMFNELATRKLGFSIKVPSGLKICDFRPAFGVIFEDYLIDYDFWGYSDTDIIFGRLGAFLTESLLNTTDFISVVKHYPSGFFAVARNSDKMINLFRSSDSYMKIFLTPENTLFEECGGYYNDVRNGINILNTESQVDTFHHLLERNKVTIKSSFEQRSQEVAKTIVKITNSKMEQCEKEIMMFHLTVLKRNFFFKPPSFKGCGDLIITEFGIQQNRLTSVVYSFLRNTFCHVKIRAAMFIDSLLRLSPSEKINHGKYHYMVDLRFEIIDKDLQLVILHDDHYFKFYRSAFFSDFHFVEKVKVYIKFFPNYIDVLFPNGSFLRFDKDKDHKD